MRSILGAMLNREGYEVELVENGEKAVEAFQTAHNLGRPFEAVILDLTIRGGIGGEKTIRELFTINPDVKAVVCSGYDQDPVIQNYAAYGFKAALTKPFVIGDLRKVLSTIMKPPSPEEPGEKLSG